MVISPSTRLKPIFQIKYFNYINKWCLCCLSSSSNGRRQNSQEAEMASPLKLIFRRLIFRLLSFLGAIWRLNWIQLCRIFTSVTRSTTKSRTKKHSNSETTSLRNSGSYLPLTREITKRRWRAKKTRITESRAYLFLWKTVKLDDSLHAITGVHNNIRVCRGELGQARREMTVVGLLKRLFVTVVACEICTNWYFADMDQRTGSWCLVGIKGILSNE